MLPISRTQLAIRCVGVAMMPNAYKPLSILRAARARSPWQRPLDIQITIIINGQILIIGDGSDVTQIDVAAPIYGDTLQFGSLQENFSWAGMYVVEISLSSTHTGGALIHAVNTHNFGVDDVVTWGAFNTVVQIIGGSSEFISCLRNC